MTESGKIDDPVDASFEAWKQEHGNLGQKASELALTFTGLVFPPARVFKILKDQFFQPNRFTRIEYLFEGIRQKLSMHDSQFKKSDERMRAIEDRLASEKFDASVSVACEEAARTPDLGKIDQFAAVLVGSLIPNRWADPNEDVGVLIRDIAQLGDKDLEALGILRKVHSSAIETAPNLYEPDPFSRETSTLTTAIGVNGFHRDDFLSACERLRGFGLAAEVLRNTSHMAPHDYCYRPTRRGLAVLDYLSKVSADCEPTGTAK